MDEKKSQQINDIYDEVAGSHAQLGAINERTRNIQESLTDIEDEVSKNRNDIDDIQDKVKRNTTVINGVTVGLSSIVLWIADKVSRLRIF